MSIARKSFSLLLSLCLAFNVAVLFAPGTVSAETKVKNVIMLIPDGMGTSASTAARIFKSGKTNETLNGNLGASLYMDDYVVGAMETYSYNNIVTDSAAAGTALATGAKTLNGAISMDKDGNPLKTLLELAEEEGKSSGLVATSRITHATPAVFAAHVPDRNMENEIAAQMITSGVDVLLGGGKRHFIPEGGKRKDGRDLIAEAKELGFTYVETADEMKNADTEKLLGLFASSHLAYEIDRETTQQPSLAEMTQKAIDILSKNNEGFFLMVEGSRIDHAGHANDAAAAIHDVLAFDEAVRVAVEFAKHDKNTLVISCADHECGGMSVGGYGQKAFNTNVIKNVNASAEYMADQINEQMNNVGMVFRTYAGIYPTAEQFAYIKAPLAEGEYLSNRISAVLSKYQMVGWTSDTHTGTDVLLYAYGPETPAGTLDNTEVGKFIAEAMGVQF